MRELNKAKEPFHFTMNLQLIELTGIRASNLKDLIKYIKIVPDYSIYFHTHRFLKQQISISPEPTNDFAHWINFIIGEENLAEQLESLDIMEFTTITSLRNEILSILTSYLKENPKAKLKFADKNEEFHFIKLINFIFPTNYFANNLKEFVDILQIISPNSIYFHIFDARFRPPLGLSDFSNWIETAVDDKELAEEIKCLDFYAYSIEDLRKAIIKQIERKILN